MFKSFLGDCIGNPFNSQQVLEDILNDGVEISKTEFVKAVELTKPILFLIKEYPNDYTFYKNGAGTLYWFVWSCIEFFYGDKQIWDVINEDIRRKNNGFRNMG